MKRLFCIALFLCLSGSTARATVVFNQPHDGGGTLHKSSWYSPDGLDGDVYCWDNFTLGSSTAVSEIRWRGGYEFHASGLGMSPVYDFDVSIYRSIAGNSQPDMGAGGRLVRYTVGGNAGEIATGSFGGVQMFDYAYTLPSPFQAVAGTTYWVQIEAYQGLASPSFAPDWGLAVGTGGNNSHFRRTTGAGFQTIANDMAFSLVASGAPTATISASASPMGSGTITGAGAYPIGSNVSLQAAANAGWGFLNWTEGATQVSASPNYSFTASVDRTLVANFDVAYTITTASFPSYAGVTTGGGVYTNGATVTVVATPNHGFVFDSWSDGSTTTTHSFPAAADVQLTAFFALDPKAVMFDFDTAPQYSSLPLAQTINGLTAQFTGGYSVQATGTVGISPAGFSGLCLWPNSVYQSDLGIRFSEALTDLSILYAVDELACDTSARMRVTAFLHGANAGTNTMTATPGVYPSATLSIAVPSGFDSVVVHWDAPGTGCQDYGPIFFADNVLVTRAVAPSGIDPTGAPALLRVYAPVPNPFRGRTSVGFALPTPSHVRVRVYDTLGHVVATLADGRLAAGVRSLTWDGTGAGGRKVASGVYFCRFESMGRVETKRMVLLR